MVKTYTQNEVDTLLQQAKVDAKAIRAEALEEAAKVCDGTAKDCSLDAYRTIRDCAAAIRGLK